MTVVPDEILAAMAERMNRLPFVIWDRCVLLQDYGRGAAYGWIARDDGRSDFVLLDFAWGETRDLTGEPSTWFSVGTTTSSAAFSEEITARILGPDAPHNACQRVDAVFGALVKCQVAS